MGLRSVWPALLTYQRSKTVTDLPQATYDDQPSNSELKLVVKDVVAIPAAAAQREEAALALGRKLMQVCLASGPLVCRQDGNACMP